ncbi:hypothetical protein [Bacillus sp. REN3]|uniref:hypothetical protein n=1 Tax=Bacillus sp. REN3 TaxID=2802440 RepID=UPI001AEDE2E1|nr:hypothetical protein [Bacillus sp. REN3]
MAVRQIRKLSKGLIMEFAEEELRKYMGSNGAVLENASFENTSEIVLATVGDIDSNEIFSKNDRSEFGAWTDDGFAILPKADVLYIIGVNERSVLFGVYQFCKDVLGYRWVTLADRNAGVKCNTLQATFHSPKYKRRGFVIETINEPQFMIKMVDWFAKQYINEVFFTFYLWDELQEVLEEELKKRGMKVTLGGHSLAFLIGEKSIPGHKQLDFGDETWQSQVIERIKEFCPEGSPVTRISLWPEDTGTENNNLLIDYLKFTERIKNALPNLDVEHIAYNAGLSWEMLELGQMKSTSPHIDTLYAFWGRNYNQPIDDHARAYSSLKSWRSETSKVDRDLTVFEYYSDHFMLSDLFPPLFNRIREDLEGYAALGVNGVTNLVVPYKPKKGGLAGKYDNFYPWREIQLMNSFFFSRLSWGDSFEMVKNEFYEIYGDHSRQWMEILENTLSQASKWNIPLFPARLMDPEQAAGSEFKFAAISHLEEMQEAIHSIIKEAKIPSIDSWLKQYDNAANRQPVESLILYILFLDEKLKEYAKKWR